MTTQARELAKLVNNSGDVNLGDDITLGSDGAVLNFGANSDVLLTHVHDTGLLLNSSRQLQFGDSGTHISQSADGVLNLTSDTEVEINATTLDINANVDISGTLTVAGVLDFGDAALSNVGALQLDSIAGDADTDTSITFSGSDVITITTGGETQVTFNNGSILPTTDADIDLGSSSLQFKDAYFHGSVETDALTIGGVSIAETIADTVGAMVSSNTESGITVAYDDADNTLDFTVGTLNQNTTGLAGTATALATARTIGGTSFDGTANIAVGLADTATALATSRTIHGVGFDGTANIDLSEVISDTVGAMFSSNTETGIVATYQDADNTIDLVIGTLNQNTTGSAATLTTPRAIAVAGDVTGTANFDGSAGISITTTLATDAIVTANITDANVTVAKMAANSIDSDQYVDGSIDTAHIGDNQVTGDKLADALTVTTSVTTPLVSITGTGNSALSVGSSNGDAAYESGYTVIEVGGSGNLTAKNASGEELFLSGNAYYNSGWKYSQAGGAGLVDIQNGRIRIRTAADGSDGGAISFTTALDIAQTKGDIAIASSARVAQVAITSSSNAVAWDAKAAQNAYHVTTENTTFSAPSNAVEGAVIQVELAQGGTPRTIAWNTVFEFAASTAPTVTATANKTDIFTFRYNGSVWQEIGRVQNMAQT